MVLLSVMLEPRTRRILILSLVARAPLGALGLLVVLQLRDLGQSYAIAGLCSGMCALGMACSAWALGRLVDRNGQTVVLLGCALFVMLASVGFATLPAEAPVVVLMVAAFVLGAAQPPVAACARVLWQRLLQGPAFAAVVTVDATLQELAFILGPLLFVSIAAAIGPATTVALVGGVLGITTVLFALLPESRRLGTGRAWVPGTSASALTDPAVRTLLAAIASLGMVLGMVELGVISMAEHHGARGATGVLYAVFGTGSFVGGMLAARRGVPADPAARMVWLMLGLAASLVVLSVLPGLVWFGVGLAVSGAAVAPLFGLAYVQVGNLAPKGTLTEAFTLQTTALTAGLALGAAMAGSINSAFGPSTVFLQAAVIMVLGAGLQRALRHRLVGPPDRAVS